MDDFITYTKVISILMNNGVAQTQFVKLELLAETPKNVEQLII